MKTDKTWLEQLELNWKKNEPDSANPYDVSIEECVLQFADWDESHISKEIITFACKAKASRVAMSHAETLQQFFQFGEVKSPIEQAMIVALEAQAKEVFNFESVVFKVEMGEGVGTWYFGDPLHSSSIEIIIEPQKKIGKYKADLFISYSEYLKKEGNANHFHTRTMIVECDGHEFHERTKEQASHDKKRDRFLQDSGFKVYRFTGSDIWKDTFKCANEILNTLRNSDRNKFPFELISVPSA